MDANCPACRKPVPAGLSDCPACGRTLFRVCSCGAEFSLAEGRCPSCGRAHRSRRGRRRFRPSGKLVAIVLLILVVGAIGAWVATRPSGEERLDLLLQDAADLMRDENYRLAGSMLVEYLEERPGDARGLFLLGACRIRTGEEELGLENAREALSIQPRLKGAHLFLARYYASKRNLRAAVEHTAQSTLPEGAILHARLLVEVGRLEDASRAYVEAISRNPDDLEVLFEAIETERRLVRGGYLGAGAHADRERNFLVACRRLVLEQLEQEPGDPARLAALARVTDEAALARPPEIEEAWRTALAVDPANPDIRVRYAGFLSRQGRREEAEALLEEGLDAIDGPEGYLLLADFHAAGGDPARTVDVTREAVEKWPDDPALRASLVRALGDADRLEEARTELAAAAEAHPGDFQLLAVGGDLMLLFGDGDAADDYYRRALDLSPRSISLLRKRIRPRIERLAVARSSGGELPENLKETGELLDRLRDMNPWDRDGQRWTALLARARGRQDLALSLVDELLRYHPDDLRSRALRGQLLYARGDHQEAAAELRRVVSSEDAELTDVLLFTRVAFPFGRFAEVAAACEKGIERWPEEVELYRFLGQSGYRLGQPGRFLRRVATAPEAVRNDRDVRQTHAWCLAATGHPDEAVDMMRGVLADDPSARSEFAALLGSLGRGEEAEQLLTEGLGEGEADDRARLDLARYFTSRGDRVNAMKALARVLARDPGNLDAALRFGEIYVSGEPEEQGDAVYRQVRDALAAVPRAAPELLYLEGLDRLRLKDGEGAVDRLARYALLRPTRFEAHANLATALVLVGEREKARSALERALQIRPEDGRVRRRYALLSFDAAMRKLGDRDLDAARTLFGQAAGVEDQGSAPQVLFAFASLIGGDLAQAEEQIDLLLEENPEDGSVWLLRALCLGRRGESAAALAAMDKVVGRLPEVPIVRAWRGFARLDGADPAGALEDFDAAERLGLGGPGLVWGRAHALARRGRMDEALALARSAVVTWPEAPVAHRLLGEMLFSSGDGTGAAEAFRRTFELQPGDLGSLAAAASLLGEAGRIDDAEKLLDQAGSQTGIVLRVRGDLARARGQVGRAEDLYRRAAVGDPGAYVSLAEIAAERGDPVAARREYEAAVAAGVDAAPVRFAYGTLLAAAGMTRDARVQFEAVLEKLPDHVPTLNNLASILGDDDLARARRLAERARELDPENPSVADTLGWIRYRAGDAKGAVPLLEEACAAQSAEPMLLYHLGMALAKAGRTAEARAALSRALTEAPDAEWNAEATKALRALK